MWLLVAEFFLKSLFAPFLAAGLIVTASRHSDHPHLSVVAPAFAIVLALSTTTILAFGWPSGLVLNARTKILISAFVGLGLGIAVERQVRGSKLLLTLAAIGIPIWVGLPTLQQGRWESVLLLLPIAVGLFALMLLDWPGRRNGRLEPLIMPIMTAGLAILAVFAKALSFSALGLALTSALLAILMMGGTSLSVAAAITSATMMLALITALLLFTDISLIALLILSTVLGAERLARLTCRNGEAPSKRRVLLFCLLPAAVAVLAARIDAGAISIY